MSTRNLTVRTSSPGKVILSGEHSVVYGKVALAASLGLRTKFELAEIDEPAVITIELASLDFVHVYCLKDIEEILQTSPVLKSLKSSYNFTNPESVDHSALVESIESYVKDWHFLVTPKQKVALTSFFYLFVGILGSFDFKLVPFTLKVDSDLTLSAGTGSSASYAVAIAAGLLQYAKVKQMKVKTGYNKSHKFGRNFDNFETDELEIISKWGFAAEKIIHGSPSGIDNTICTYGALVEFRRGTAPKLVALTTKFRLLLINTNVPRDTKILVDGVANFSERHPKIVAAILDVIETTTCDVLGGILTINASKSPSEEEYVKLGELFEINHNLLRTLGVSHPRLDEVCDILKGSANLKGKLTGAGGGGYAICLIPPSIEARILEEAISNLKGSGFTVILTDLGGEGATVD